MHPTLLALTRMFIVLIYSRYAWAVSSERWMMMYEEWEEGQIGRLRFRPLVNWPSGHHRLGALDRHPLCVPHHVTYPQTRYPLAT